MASTSVPDPYLILGVGQKAQLHEIKRAYRKLILKCHPDKHPGESWLIDEFHKVQQAYDTLSDDDKRKQYDKQVRLAQLSKRLSKDGCTRNSITHRIPRKSAQNSTARAPEGHGCRVLEGIVNDQSVTALPDTGAEKSMMAASFAKTLGLLIKPQAVVDVFRLQMANGKHIRALGTVRATWRLKRDPAKTWKWTFTVLEDCVFDIIIGDDFLMPNKIFSTNKHLLSWKPRPINAIYIRNVNILGRPSHRLSGSLNNERVLALPDSGAEPNLVSYAYAKARGWLLELEEDSQHLLQFADGSLARTEGQVHAKWEFQSRRPKRVYNYKVAFEVLRDCPFDVVLGQDFLEYTDAFSQFQHFFREVCSSNGIIALSLVIWLPNFLKNQTDSTTRDIEGATEMQIARRNNDNELDQELHRRALSDRALRRMKGVEDFQAAQRERRRQWETEHQHIRHERPLVRRSHNITADHPVFRTRQRVDGS